MIRQLYIVYVETWGPVMFKIILSCLMLLCSVATAFADPQLLGTYHVSRVFSEGSSTAGFYTQEGLPECIYGIMYIDLVNESGKAQFSMALTAKTTGQSIVRMDYFVNEHQACVLKGLHMQ